jgi:hypothetical protein
MPEQLVSAVNRQAERDTKRLRFYMIADRSGVEVLNAENGFIMPSGEVDINPVVDTVDISSSNAVSTGETNLFKSSQETWPAFKILGHDFGLRYPQDVVLVFPYGYLVRAKLNRRRFSFLTGKSRLYLDSFSTIRRSQWEEPTVPKTAAPEMKDPENNIFIALRARAQIEFSNTAVRGSVKDQAAVLEAQRKLFETLVYHLYTGEDLTLESLASLNSQVGLYLSKIKSFYDSDVAPYPFDGYVGEYIEAPADVAALAGVIRGSNQSTQLASTMGQSSDAILNFIPPQYVVGEVQRLLDFINSLDRNSDLYSVAFAYKSFLSIHPFSNANGRVARALLDYMLIKTGYSPLEAYDETTAWVHWQSIEELTFNLSKNLSR